MRTILAIQVVLAILVVGCGEGESTTTAGQTTAPPVATTAEVVTTTEAAVATSVEQPTTTMVEVASPYPWHREIMATIFWLGEEAGEDNANTDNISTAWDEHAVETFGGFVDLPEERNGVHPKEEPAHNDHYVAVPFSDYGENGPRQNRDVIPWYDLSRANDETISFMKGRWVEVKANGRVAFGQIVDAGPHDPEIDPDGANDPEYVFGVAAPKNTFGLKAGIDLSPAMALSLGFDKPISQSGGLVDWRFVEEDVVPDGPWKDFPPIDNKTNWD